MGMFCPATGSPSARRMSWPRSAGVRPPEIHHPVWRQECERGTSLTGSPPHLSYDDVTLFVLVQVAQQGAGVVGAVEGPQVFELFAQAHISDGQLFLHGHGDGHTALGRTI